MPSSAASRPFAGRRVAQHEVVERDAGRAHPLARAGEAADGVAVAAQARDERGADVAGHACDEGLQAVAHAPQADTRRKPRRLRHRHPAKGEEIA